MSRARTIQRTALQAVFALAALTLSACATLPDATLHPEARSYSATADAAADVDAALARAAASGKRVLLVMGANWCHDSRALAGWLETPRFAALTAMHYEVVFVDVGMPQTGDGENLDVARRFGLAELPGTPALLVLGADGKALNLDTAASWRNAASRSEDAIYAELAALAAPSLEASLAQGDADATVWVDGDETGCRFALTQDGPWVRAASELVGLNESSGVHIRTAQSTPWRCVAAGIHQLQQLGVKVPIGFVSDPAD